MSRSIKDFAFVARLVNAACACAYKKEKTLGWNNPIFIK